MRFPEEEKKIEKRMNQAKLITLFHLFNAKITDGKTYSANWNFNISRNIDQQISIDKAVLTSK